MPQLSPQYRNDKSVGINPVISTYLDEHYLRHLKNIRQANPKLLVVFSGGNAMGKTTIARKIEAALHGLVLENDEIKRRLLHYMPDIGRDTLNTTTWQYTMDVYRRLDSVTPNGLIVRDGVIDWYYDRILPIFEQSRYCLFIVGFDVSRQKAIELIKQRGDTPTVKETRFYQLLDDHAVHIKQFRQLYTPDIILTDDTIFDHQAVLDTLKQRLAQLST